jgi:hypothetical protein
MTGKQERIRLGKGCLTTRELTIGSVNEARCSLLMGMQVSRLGSTDWDPFPGSLLRCCRAEIFLGTSQGQWPKRLPRERFKDVAYNEGRRQPIRDGMMHRKKKG